MSDKRSVNTDALATLGNIITDGGRDAIHLAVEPVIAGEILKPGFHIGLDDGRAYATRDCKKLGIVDPFLSRAVEEGEMFWLIVYPRQITSLRHVWSHPDFPEEGAKIGNKSISEEWLKDFCEQKDFFTYEMLIANAQKGFEKGEYGEAIEDQGDYLLTNGFSSHGYIPSVFWDHLEVVTGRKFTNRPTYFSCSC